MPCGQCATADSLRTHGREPLLIRPRPLSHNNNAPGDSRATRAPACRGLMVGHPSGSSEARHSRSRRALLPGSRRNNPTVSSVSHGLPLTELHHVSSGPVNGQPLPSLHTLHRSHLYKAPQTGGYTDDPSTCPTHSSNAEGRQVRQVKRGAATYEVVFLGLGRPSRTKRSPSPTRATWACDSQPNTREEAP
jgi:hypothetical protein